MQEKKGTKAFKKVSSVICSYIGILLLSVMIITSCSADTPQRGNYTIKGRVVQKTDSTAIGLSGVKIAIRDTNIKSVTVKDGYYVLNHVSGEQLELTAEMEGLFFIPDFSELKQYNGSFIDVRESSINALVSNANFTATKTVTISQIQGKGHISPIVNNAVEDIEGVVTSVTQLRPHYKFDEIDTDVTLKDQIISEDGFYMQMVTPDGDPLTSDGIFVSTRNEKGPYNESSWLDSCKVTVTDASGNSTTRLPQPGDIVRVSGIVREVRPVNRFNESADRLSRTQINASSVEYIGQKEGGITTSDCVLITYTEPTGKDPDSWRVLNFNEPGLDMFRQACDLFESVEGMLVQINEPIVVGTTYYNHTTVMADGGKKNGVYSETFNPKWMAPVVRENNYNAGLIHLYYEKSDVSKSLGALPQIGTVLTDDKNNKVFRGCMDYSSEGTYIINPIRKDKEDSVSIDYSNVKFPRHDKYGFKLNATADSFYAENYRLANLVEEDFPANSYQKILYSKSPRNKTFTVPWDMEPVNSKSKYMSVAVFNLENYSDAGRNYSKKENIGNAIGITLQCPDLIFIVEMGDDKHEGTDNIIYDNQDSSWLQPTGYVSAAENYTTLIDYIKHEYGIEYDYRQIDPIEFDQAGAPGMNIRVGFMFRTDRIEAVDSGMLTNTYRNTVFEDEVNVIEEYQHELSLQNAIPYKNKYDEINLTQSPGFIQHPDFYHSRIPLACKFIFKPTQEYFIGIACHLYAKGGDAPLYGIQQPPVFTSEIRRANQTNAIHEYIEQLQSLDENVKIIVGGDMNDFGFTTPIKLLTGEFGGDQILYSMSDLMPENERFSYTFKGNLQQLDHIFVTKNLYAETVRIPGNWDEKVYIPHIDSLFSRINHIQISDHDPLAARINME